jgi:hypothetical protein
LALAAALARCCRTSSDGGGGGEAVRAGQAATAALRSAFAARTLSAAAARRRASSVQQWPRWAGDGAWRAAAAAEAEAPFAGVDVSRCGMAAFGWRMDLGCPPGAQVCVCVCSGVAWWLRRQAGTAREGLHMFDRLCWYGARAARGGRLLYVSIACASPVCWLHRFAYLLTCLHFPLVAYQLIIAANRHNAPVRSASCARCTHARRTRRRRYTRTRLHNCDEYTDDLCAVMIATVAAR